MTRIVLVLGLMFLGVGCDGINGGDMAFRAVDGAGVSHSFDVGAQPVSDCDDNGNNNDSGDAKTSAAECLPDDRTACHKEIDEAVEEFYKEFGEALSLANEDIHREEEALRKRLKDKGASEKEIEEAIAKLRKEKEEYLRKALEAEEEFQKEMDVLRKKCFGDNWDKGNA